MFTPYDWQEGIGNRASYVEAKLAHGAPVLAVSLDEGILMFTYRRQSRKIYEIYDRLIFGALGQQSDIEALRTAAVEFAHQEGYNRSEQDVTIQRVATALSIPLKRAFADFSVVPIVAKALFGEVGDQPEDDLYYSIDYDGDYATSQGRGAIAGTAEGLEGVQERLSEISASGGVDAALEGMKAAWAEGMHGDEETGDPTAGLETEVVLLSRTPDREDRFITFAPVG
jgi:proteasome alpha subunit